MAGLLRPPGATFSYKLQKFRTIRQGQEGFSERLQLGTSPDFSVTLQSQRCFQPEERWASRWQQGSGKGHLGCWFILPPLDPHTHTHTHGPTGHTQRPQWPQWGGAAPSLLRQTSKHNPFEFFEYLLL